MNRRLKVSAYHPKKSAKRAMRQMSMTEYWLESLIDKPISDKATAMLRMRAANAMLKDGRWCEVQEDMNGWFWLKLFEVPY